MRRPEDLLGLFIADEEELRPFAGQGPLITDDRPLIEYFLSLPREQKPPDLSPFRRDPSRLRPTPARR